MDETPHGWAYRCLPLVIGNQLGWDIFAPTDFTATWDGGAEPGCVTIEFPEDAEGCDSQIRSHFGAGIVTLYLPWIFRTEEPIGLIVRGPTNSWVDGAAPLDAFVETWGLESTFTMNWKLTVADRRVCFNRSLPICTIQPYDLSMVTRAETKTSDLDLDPQTRKGFASWAESRASFNEARTDPRSWQKTYSRGKDSSGGSVSSHVKSLKLPSF